MADPLDLTGRVGVVTGASRGIGAAIADTLARHGMDLVLNAGASGETLAELAQTLTAQHGVRVDTVSGDVSDPATSADLARQAFGQHRRLDVWVNNAGILLDGLIGMTPTADIERTLAVNLAGTLHGTQAASRLMARSGGGSIVNMTSIIGQVGMSGHMAYGASKAGVIGATLSAAKELAPKGIRVNAVAPGLIDTGLVAHVPPEKLEARAASIRMGRIGDPQDVANAVLFLVSDLSRYITGQVLGVDGGMALTS
ncbi:SDR family NAD(P)-dependent oxidoreductase [Pannonibacter tanglangensis]|uniref:Glucose 1-dehydrogenase n=1 Tax=Pannonibacter tanglangensis TaxID=2750084 RepID=A0ABW9ZJ70_9HYPH|nr:glucose 1-dehydrogenase [Pannonibacter sp. XCT-34]NBN64932.1 glucose 1-dehydrogenase [Pannonibacter sp. XCT-34]